MGSINRFDLNRIMHDYRSIYFVETGTFRGDGVAYALESPFKKIVSVEIVPEIASEAKKRFSNESTVEILESDSFTFLTDKLSSLQGNSIFWLDAHFPGADAGLTNYDADGDESVRLPLARELKIISQQRKEFKDVLIIDDLRIYEEGPYQNGNVPADALPKGSRDINFVYEHFESTHLVLKSYLDEGYLLLFPKKIYKRKHFSLFDLFRKKSLQEDHYLNER